MPLVTALRLLAALSGSLILYSVAAVYENEEGRLQSRLENAWLHLAYAQDRAVPVHTQVVSAVLGGTGRGLDRCFGVPLLSWRFVTVSTCLSFATGTLVSVAAAQSTGELTFWLALLGWSVFGLLVGAAILPMFSDRLAPVAGGVALIAVALQLSQPHNTLLYALILSWSLLVGATTLAAVRSVYRRLKLSPSIVRVLLGLATTTLIIMAIIYGPLLYFAGLDSRRWEAVSRPDAWEAGFIGLATWMNLWVLVPTSLVILVLTTFVIHRIVWAAALRPLYLAQRLRLLQHRKLLIAIAAYLLLISIQPRYATISGLAQVIGIRLPATR